MTDDDQDNASSDHWQIDKRIPLAMLIFLAANFGGGIWWLAGLSGRVTNLEAFKASIEATRQINLSRITVLEQQNSFVKELLIRIETKLDRKENP